MNKKLGIVIAVVLLLLLIAGGGLVAMKSLSKPALGPATTETALPATPSPAESQTGTIQGTLKSLLTGGQTTSCTYTRTVGNSTVGGKVYVSSGKMRGDFTEVNSTNNQTVTSHVVTNDGQTIYAWTDLSNRGVKLSVSAATAANLGSNSPNIDEPQQFSCQDWTSDPAVFVVPTTVTFYSLNSLIPSSPQASSPGTSGSPAACAACNSLPIQAQQVCKEQLHCP